MDSEMMRPFPEKRHKYEEYVVEATGSEAKHIIELLQAEAQGKLVMMPRNRPEIVCLCGSTRFFKTFDEQNFRLTLKGLIVLSIGCNTKSDEGLKLTAEDKERLDELHKRKIDLCDSVVVLNVDGYIGDSTRSEIEYANKIGKPVNYLYPGLRPDNHC